jgi:hypothetical protein
MTDQPGEKERFEVLLEQVRHELEVLAEGHVTLDQKIDRVAQELSKKMDVGFADVLAAVRTVVKQLQEHERAHAG